MLTVALVGADGAGKSTVVARLSDALGVPVRTMYLGVNPAAATHPLPTTSAIRWARRVVGRERHAGGPPPIEVPSAGPDQVSNLGRVASGLGGAARITNRIAEESYQRAVCRWHLHRGRVVLFDRYYGADYHAHDLAGGKDLSRTRRLHGAYLRRWYPDPDLVIVLDAPADVLHARKGEGTIAELASRRAEYLAYARAVPRAVIVDAGRPLDQVVRVVVTAIGRALDGTGPPTVDRGEHPAPGGAR